MAFIHSGQEFFRTKDEIDNTYNVPDRINRLDWTRAIRYKEHIEFIQELITFRKIIQYSARITTKVSKKLVISTG